MFGTYLYIHSTKCTFGTYMYIPPNTQTHKHTNTQTYIHTHMHTHTYIHTYIHTYKHTYIHAHIQTYTHMLIAKGDIFTCLSLLDGFLYDHLLYSHYFFATTFDLKAVICKQRIIFYFICTVKGQRWFMTYFSKATKTQYL